MLGRNNGWSNYSTESNEAIRKRLRNLKEDFFANKEKKDYITKREVEIKEKQLRREIKYMPEVDRIATEKFLKEINEKLK
jgi:ribosomal protein S15P/S13E